jgi:hypothetical protein
LVGIRINLLVAAFATACVLASPVAHAFTMQDKDAADPYALPKFDLEEQSRNFRTGSVGSSSNANKLFETPLGNGTLQFGIQQGSASNFLVPGLGSTFGPEFNSRNSREDFNRVVTPENLR